MKIQKQPGYDNTPMELNGTPNLQNKSKKLNCSQSTTTNKTKMQQKWVMK